MKTGRSMAHEKHRSRRCNTQEQGFSFYNRNVARNRTTGRQIMPQRRGEVITVIYALTAH